jgi:hypothetical protein
MVTTPAPTKPVEMAAPIVGMPATKTQPLWRFAMVGLGPLTVLGVFALASGVFQRLT